EAEARGGNEEPAGTRHSFWSYLRHPTLFHHAFNRGFERLRLAYKGLLGWALHHRFLTLTALLGFALGSLALFPRTGQDFFPSVDAGQFRMHVRTPAGTRIEETERIFGQIEDAIREFVPDSDRAMILDNMGLTQSFTIMAYVDNGTVSEADGEILVALKPEHGPSADYVAQLRRELPRRFPQCTFFFEPADITSQILNFGLPAPIDVQVVGVNREGNLAVAQKLRREIARIPGVAGEHQPLRRPAGLRCLRQRAGARPGSGSGRRAEGHRRGPGGIAAGQHDRHAGPGADHEQFVHRAHGRPGLRRSAGLLPDGGQL